MAENEFPICYLCLRMKKGEGFSLLFVTNCEENEALSLSS
ncbi:hypothetical protein PORCRE_892 [Porphyromonas crevioricanis JCM 15906]|uniref:Uncharacterized protein n=1 Tax=Porphyromonas crevioricanis JCM 15906 TaxID=1305617 RepID=T1CN29_9PORP|nr:hypothetical protein PORCRE_892 [Porphyromonas crevioricanis JCM 15906]GAD06475.1 hypothetical protein PORCAN_71 [Porphyromonas crevioricanis JCM 13913]